jgi:limonene-1,2-epoxide hydrolase
VATSPEAVVKDFLAAWGHPDADRLAGFFRDDAVYVDGPGNVHRGADAIRKEFERQLVLGGQGVEIEVKRAAGNGRVVMIERVDRFAIGGQTFELEAVGVYEIDDDGQIGLFRDYYDQAALARQLEAAGFQVT